MRLSSPILTHYRQALLLIGWFVISLILLRSLLRDASFNTVLEPTPYRLDLTLWPSNATSGVVVERLTFDNDWKPVTAVIHQVSSNESDIRHRVHELLEYPFIQQVLIHRGDATLTTKLTVEVCVVSWMGRDPYLLCGANLCFSATGSGSFAASAGWDFWTRKQQWTLWHLCTLHDMCYGILWCLLLSRWYLVPSCHG